ncbi:hypothetical protein A0168_RS14735 [Acinetobacter baumannii]|uniref:hypothetical protein n=1 Tax=Acinetobacter baumannii TaxID=470 RepID=UPI000DCFD316|nr:hypothetical protein [Acinetobacter baumannii]EHU1785236.1 hypothetical protein [Acinetobacter baumannii]EHU2236004.1 hypothetical protein [Acinetobacter baumannii]EHU2344424.1 hypothetical protein [Acinetobacter baumannii]EHU2416798.1 hypothetical protein [Acinetobacter baumannii]EHU2908404.1 hypothetical protein [Acinetobacter baumannii]
MEIKAGDKNSYKNLGINSVKHIATLDLNCCLICAAFDGRITHVDKANDHPLHKDCRCLVIPVAGDGTTIGNRPYKIIINNKHEIGTINSNITFADWFQTLDEEIQAIYLGEFRFNLYKNNEFQLRDFVNLEEHRELTQTELEVKLHKKCISQKGFLAKVSKFFKGKI